MESALIGGIAAGVGYGFGKFIANQIYKTKSLTFSNYYDLGKTDTGAFKAAIYAFRSSWYTFMPSIATSSSRGLIKFLGNKGVAWF